jgi:hypothetical protein
MMVLRSFAGAMLALAVAMSPALACKGANEIYSDDFTDANGPWEGTDNATIGGGVATLKADSGKAAALIYTGGTFQEFDLCVDIAMPATRDPNGGAVAGILFWFTPNPAEFFGFIITPGGMAGALRLKNEKPVVVSPFRKQNAIKTGTDAKNTFRLTAKGNSLTVYGNDQRLAGFRGTPADGYVGLYAEGEKDTGSAWKFSNFKMTEP